MQRIQAEFENFKKRTEKDSKNIWRNSKADFAKKLLPIIDTFEAAIKTSQNKNENGLALIFEQFKKTLYSEGLSEINTGGEFNPDFHEAMLQQKSDEFEDDEITDVLQKGYLFCDYVIRPAKVKINVRVSESGSSGVSDECCKNNPGDEAGQESGKEKEENPEKGKK